MSRTKAEIQICWLCLSATVEHLEQVFFFRTLVTGNHDALFITMFLGSSKFSPLAGGNIACVGILRRDVLMDLPIQTLTDLTWHTVLLFRK